MNDEEREKEEVKIAGNRRRESTVQRVQLKEGIASGAVTYYLRFDGSAMQSVVRVCSAHTEENTHDTGITGTRGVNVDAPAAYFLLLYLPPSCPTAAFGVIISAYSAVTRLRERKHVNYSVYTLPRCSRRDSPPLFARFFDKSRNIEANYKLDGRARQFLVTPIWFSPCFLPSVIMLNVVTLNVSPSLRCLVVENDCI